MKTLLLIPICILLLACDQLASRGNDNQQLAEQSLTELASPQDDGTNTSPGSLFILIDAEKILGERGHLNDSLTKREGNETIYQCSYKANAEDIKKHKTGIVYFLAEYYDDEASAQKRYSFIKNANAHNGTKTVNDLGDEAYFHSDNENFYFIMVRKGAKVFNMKVNKITSMTSLDAFNAVARQITAAL